MRRREFITLLGGAAAACPFSAGAQQAERVRRIGILSPLPEKDPEGQARSSAAVQALQQLGWIAGKNVIIDYRWVNNNAEGMRRYAAELVALSPECRMHGGKSTGAPKGNKNALKHAVARPPAWAGPRARPAPSVTDMPHELTYKYLHCHRGVRPADLRPVKKLGKYRTGN